MIQLVVPGAALSPSPSGPASATASCCLFELPTAGRKRRMDGLTGGTGGSFIFVLYSVCPMTCLDDRRGSGRSDGVGGWEDGKECPDTDIDCELAVRSPDLYGMIPSEPPQLTRRLIWLTNANLCQPPTCRARRDTLESQPRANHDQLRTERPGLLQST